MSPREILPALEVSTEAILGLGPKSELKPNQTFTEQETAVRKKNHRVHDKLMC